MRIYLLICISFFSLSCSTNRSIGNEITVLELTSRVEAYSLDKQAIYNIGNSFKIIYNDDCMLYMIPIFKQDRVPILDNIGKKTELKVVGVDTSYTAYVIKIGGLEGFKYTVEKLNEEKGTVFRLDSLLEDLLISSNNLIHFSHELGTPSEEFKTRKLLVEKYAIKKTASSDPDSVYRYYDSKLKNIKFTFSEGLDARRNRKLYKTSFIHNAVPNVKLTSEQRIPRRELFYQILRVEEKNTRLFEEIFSKFKKDTKTLKLR